MATRTKRSPKSKGSSIVKTDTFPTTDDGTQNPEQGVAPAHAEPIRSRTARISKITALNEPGAPAVGLADAPITETPAADAAPGKSARRPRRQTRTAARPATTGTRRESLADAAIVRCARDIASLNLALDAERTRMLTLIGASQPASPAAPPSRPRHPRRPASQR